MNEKIDNYIKEYLSREYDIFDPFESNGEIESQFIRMNEILYKQDIIIKLISKQKDTVGKSGFGKALTEFQNTLWRFVLGEPEQVYRKYLMFKYNPGIKKKFEDFCLKVKEDSILIDFSAPGRLFIDVSNTCQREKITGIQRVVFEISRRLLNTNSYLLLITDEGMLSYNLLTGFEKDITFRRGDVLLMPEVGIDHCNLLVDVMFKNKSAGGRNVSIVYDLIPINYPLTCAPAVSYKFHHWLKNCALESDLVLSNTETVATQIRSIAHDYLDGKTGSPKIDYFKLGCEIPAIKSEAILSNTKLFSFSTANVFLSVGTIEPRKGYAISLDAADRAWRSGADFIYVIVGRYGWSQAKIRERILNHDLYGKKLIWLEDVNDAELTKLYKISKFLIFPSIDEGFGLPLVEAAQHNLPAIASDIPVFREIAGDSARYFEAANSDELAEAIICACGQPKIMANVEKTTWTCSIYELIEKINDN